MPGEIGNSGGKGLTGDIRQAAIAKATGLSNSEWVKNNRLGPGPPRSPNAEQIGRVRAEYAEQRKDQAEAKAKQNYRGGSRPRPIPPANGENRGAFNHQPANPRNRQQNV